MKQKSAILVLAMMIGACSGGGSPSNSDVGTSGGENCSGSCTASAPVLTVADVQQVIARAVGEAQSLGIPATIAVVDRVGNVLAVYRMGDPNDREVLVSTTTGSGSPGR